MTESVVFRIPNLRLVPRRFSGKKLNLREVCDPALEVMVRRCCPPVFLKVLRVELCHACFVSTHFLSFSLPLTSKHLYSTEFSGVLFCVLYGKVLTNIVRDLLLVGTEGRNRASTAVWRAGGFRFSSGIRW